MLASGQIPHYRHLVIAASGQLPPVGAEGNAADVVGVTLNVRNIGQESFSLNNPGWPHSMSQLPEVKR